MKKNRTVFISSTFEDLKNHRKEVWDILSKYDVNIRGMERFGARKEAPLETCLSEVEQSDIFVGIISYRLGTIDKKSAKSFVQCEYEKALELGREIFIYLIDDNEGIVNPKFVDFGEKHEKLKAFKSILKERHTIDTFKTPDDLAEKLDEKFNELLLKKEETEPETSDEFARSKEIMNKFLLLPNTYSDKQIKLKLKIVGDPFPASKAVCEEFYLSYGSTLGVKIKVLQPEDKGYDFEYLFITENEVENFFKIEKDAEFEIYATLRFSPNTIETIRAYFVSKTYITVPVTPTTNFDLLSSYPGYEERTESGEGQIIIQLKSFLE